MALFSMTLYIWP